MKIFKYASLITLCLSGQYLFAMDALMEKQKQISQEKKKAAEQQIEQQKPILGAQQVTEIPKAIQELMNKAGEARAKAMQNVFLNPTQKIPNDELINAMTTAEEALENALNRMPSNPLANYSSPDEEIKNAARNELARPYIANDILDPNKRKDARDFYTKEQKMSEEAAYAAIIKKREERLKNLGLLATNHKYLPLPTHPHIENYLAKGYYDLRKEAFDEDIKYWEQCKRALKYMVVKKD